MNDKLMVFEQNGKILGGSRIIAKRFDKHHDNDMDAIRALVGGALKNKEAIR